MPVGAGKLSIDIDGAADVLAARRQRVSRNETIDDRFDRRSFLRREKLPGAE
jgi:hypothetical protein